MSIRPALFCLALLCAAPGTGAAPAPDPAPDSAPAQPGQAKPIPFKPDGADADLPIAQVALVTVLMLALAWGVLHVIQRYVPQSRVLRAGTSRRLRVVEAMRLSHKSWLFLVEYEDRTLLLSQCGDRLTVIAADAATRSDELRPPTPG